MKQVMSMVAGILAGISSLHAATDQERLAALEAQVETLTRASTSGHTIREVNIHGYGELHYNTTSQDGKSDKIDMHRLVIGVSSAFSDNILFDAEVDFEHAATELELEFAQVSFLLSDAINFRIGSMLMPIGSLNEFHEPTGYYSVERPHVQKNVIPTTWSEGGFGIFGTIADLEYRLYLVGGLDALEFTGESGIRGGRGKVAEAMANDVAVAGRIEYQPCMAFKLGVSGYTGGADQDREELGDIDVEILEADALIRYGILELRGLACHVGIDGTENLNAQIGDVVGSEIFGWTVEGALHLGRWGLPEPQNTVLFVRYETFNTQDTVATGFSANAANDRDITAMGIAYYPVPNVAIKVDVERWENGLSKQWTQANAGLAFTY